MHRLGISLVVILLMLTACKASESETSFESEINQVEARISDYVIIKEEINDKSYNEELKREVDFLCEVPVLLIDKPIAKEINQQFLKLEKDHEKYLYKSLLSTIHSSAYLNEGVISLVMTIHKPGPGGVVIINYDIENDRIIEDDSLLVDFDTEQLIENINRQQVEGDPLLIDMIINTILIPVNGEYTEEMFRQAHKMHEEKQEIKEQFIRENVHQLDYYLNEDGNFVFIHRGMLEDEKLVVK